MPSTTTLTVRILGQDLPGLRFGDHRAVHVGVQRGAQVIDLVPGDAPEAVFVCTIDVVRGDDGRVDFCGPFVHGTRGARFVYLSWGDLHGGGQFRMFRRAKLPLSALAERDVAGRLALGTVIEAVVNLTDTHGGPICASLRPSEIGWRVPEGA